jgi:hypothetical protein
MTINTKHLRVLAEAATPGPWMRLFGERTVYDRMEDGCRGIAIVRSDYSPPTQKEAANIDYIAACSPDVLLALLDALERKDNLLREQLTICKYLSRSICMTDETGADTNPDNIVDSSIEAITKEIGA